MLISRYELTNGTILLPLILIYLEPGLSCTKVYRLVQYSPVKCFNNFFQSAVIPRLQGDENPNFSVVAETTKLPASRSFCYQIMDCSRHAVTRYKNDEKSHAAIKNKMLKRLGHINDQFYKVDLASTEIAHKESILVGFFILHYAKLRMLELYYNFF